MNKSERKLIKLQQKAQECVSHVKAQKIIKKAEEFLDLLENWQDNPHQSANHLALGMDLDQRKKARGLKGKSSVPTWV